MDFRANRSQSESIRAGKSKSELVKVFNVIQSHIVLGGRKFPELLVRAAEISMYGKFYVLLSRAADIPRIVHCCFSENLTAKKITFKKMDLVFSPVPLR